MIRLGLIFFGKNVVFLSISGGILDDLRRSREDLVSWSDDKIFFTLRVGVQGMHLRRTIFSMVGGKTEVIG